MGCTDMITDNGMVFEGNLSTLTTGKCNSNIDICIGCFTKWNKGIHKFSIKSATRSHTMDAFGITTNIKNFCTIKDWYNRCATQTGAETYAMNGSSMFDGGHIPSKSIKMKSFNGGRKVRKGDIITIIFDGDNWTVSFLVNGYEQMRQIKITPNLVYSPFIALNGYSTFKFHYQIIHQDA